MIKINDILPLINTSLKTHYFEDITAYDVVVELIGQEGEDTTKRPAIYEGNGNYKFIQEDTRGLIIYHRLISFNNDEDQEKGFGRNSLTKETYELKSVFYGQQSAIKTENEDINYLLSQEFKKIYARAVSSSNIRISITGNIETNKKTIEEEEGLKTVPESVCFTITSKIVIINTENCNDLSCDNIPYEFCKPVTVIDGEIITEVASGGSYTCENVGGVCDDATYTITDTNATVLYSGNIASGGNLDQIIQNSNISNSDASFNGSLYAEQSFVLSDIRIRRSDTSTIQTYPASKNYTVADTQLDIYVNNVFDQTVLVMASTNETINITP